MQLDDVKITEYWNKYNKHYLMNDWGFIHMSQTESLCN